MKKEEEKKKDEKKISNEDLENVNGGVVRDLGKDLKINSLEVLM